MSKKNTQKKEGLGLSEHGKVTSAECLGPMPPGQGPGRGGGGGTRFLNA